MAEVALNDEAFLDVLFRIYEVFTERILGRDFDPCIVAEELTILSQEPLSSNFYASMVGCSKSFYNPITQL